MTGYPFALGLTAVVVVFVLLLLRTRRLREKYAAIWLVLAVAVVVLAVFPDLALWLAERVGVETPVNLLFSGAIVVLLAVCIQLSSEVSALEEETRTVAEELALLAERVDRLERAADVPTTADDGYRFKISGDYATGDFAIVTFTGGWSFTSDDAGLIPTPTEYPTLYTTNGRTYLDVVIKPNAGSSLATSTVGCTMSMGPGARWMT